MENKMNDFKRFEFMPINSFFNSKNTSITTTVVDRDEIDTRKSRIEHLPSYNKQDLSRKIQFVVVFQTIEIERLSLEIESLRINLKDSERQITNYLNYQIQIRQLMQNSHQMQQQQLSYQNQVQTMSMTCSNLYQEMHQMKKQHYVQIQRMRNQIARFNWQLERKNDGLLDADRKNKNISQELVRLNQNIMKSQQKINQLKQKDQENANNNEKNIQQERIKSQHNNQKFKHLDIQCRRQTKLIEQLCQRQKYLNNQIASLNQTMNTKDNVSRQTSDKVRIMQNQFEHEKKKSIQINHKIEELKEEINKRIIQIKKMKDFLDIINTQNYKRRSENEKLMKKVLEFERFVKEITLINEQNHKLGFYINQKDEDLINKFQFITDLTIQNKQMIMKNEVLTLQINQCHKIITQMENKYKQQQSVNWKQRDQTLKLCKKDLDNQIKKNNIISEHKNKLEKEIENYLKQANFKEQLKRQIKKMIEMGKQQEREIQHFISKFVNIQKIIKKLKQKEGKTIQICNQNTILRQKLWYCISINENVIKCINSIYSDLALVNEDNIRLLNQNKQQQTKDDKVGLERQTSKGSIVGSHQKFSHQIKINRTSTTKSILYDIQRIHSGRKILQSSIAYPYRGNNYLPQRTERQ